MLIAAVVALTACTSESDEQLTPAQFRAKANAECQSLETASKELTKASDPSAVGDVVQRYVSRAAGILRTRLRAVDELVPPDGIADRVTRLVSTLEKYANQLEDLGALTEPNQSFAALQRAQPERVKRLNDLANRANQIAADLGLVECISGAA
jgi:ABC-type enterochelin transport system substrate-binding protein